MSREYNGITFPSDEEAFFYAWCEEAKKHCIIRDFEHQPESYLLSLSKSYRALNTKLKKKVAYVDRELLKAHKYTGDFMVKTNYPMPFKKLFQNDDMVLVDTKGTHQDHDGGRSFSINQKWLYQSYGIYVHKVVPEEFFQKTFVPELARYTEKRRDVKKCYRGTRLVRDYAGMILGGGK